MSYMQSFIATVNSFAIINKDNCCSVGCSMVSQTAIDSALKFFNTIDKIAHKPIKGTITTDDNETIVAEFWNNNKKLTLCFGDEIPTYVISNNSIVENGKLLEDNDSYYVFSWIMKEQK